MPSGSVESLLLSKFLYPIRESGQSVDGETHAMIGEEGKTGLTGRTILSGGRRRHPLYSSIEDCPTSYPTQKKIRHTTRYIRKGEKLLRDWVYNINLQSFIICSLDAIAVEQNICPTSVVVVAEADKRIIVQSSTTLFDTFHPIPHQQKQQEERYCWMVYQKRSHFLILCCPIN